MQRGPNYLFIRCQTYNYIGVDNIPVEHSPLQKDVMANLTGNFIILQAQYPWIPFRLKVSIGGFRGARNEENSVGLNK